MKVFVIDDHKIVRDGLKLILQTDPEFVLAGEADNLNDTLAKLPLSGAEIILLDITLGRESGLSFIPHILKLMPDSKIVMLSMHEGKEYISRSFKAGASAYLPKGISPAELIEVLKILKTEKIHYLPGQLDMVGKSASGESPLTDREIEILRLIAQGLSSKQIADQLGLSSRTVETHRFNIVKKLAVSNSIEAISKGIEQGYISR